MSKLIEQEGKLYKECGVVILESLKDSLLHITVDKGIMIQGKKEFPNEDYPNLKCQHLYVTSDDKPEENDWCLCYGEIEDNKQHNCSINDKRYISPLVKWSSGNNCSGCKKIIATTNTSLKIPHKHKELPNWSLPQPSDKFIQAFIEAYNKGEKIEKVLVEYEADGLNPRCVIDGTSGNDSLNWIPKVKDNNIIIKKVKDSWSKEEMLEVFLQCNHDLRMMKAADIRKWFEGYL